MTSYAHKLQHCAKDTESDGLEQEYKYVLETVYRNAKTFRRTTPCPWMEGPRELRYPRYKSPHLLARLIKKKYEMYNFF